MAVLNMWADIDSLYDETITIVNRRDAKDAGVSFDEYHATVLHGCMWSSTSQRAVQSDGTVSVGTVHRVQIPESVDYVPYVEWVKAPDGFTIHTGDYIFKGKIEQELDASSIKKLAAVLEPDVFQVQHFRDLTKRSGFEHGDGIERFAEVYYIEG